VLQAQHAFVDSYVATIDGTHDKGALAVILVLGLIEKPILAKGERAAQGDFALLFKLGIQPFGVVPPFRLVVQQ